MSDFEAGLKLGEAIDFKYAWLPPKVKGTYYHGAALFDKDAFANRNNKIDEVPDRRCRSELSAQRA